MTFKFTGRAAGSDPTGYVYVRWDRAQQVSVLAETRAEATTKALAMLGTNPRWGNHRNHGWALRWDSVEEQPVIDWRSQYPEFAAWLDERTERDAGSTA